MRRLPLNSVRNRLVVLFFAITAAAIAFVYLYVVPQLRTSLTAQKLPRLEAVAPAQAERWERAVRRGASQARLRRLARELVVSTPLADVDEAVALVRRQILIAGAIALAAAALVGSLAARAHSGRLRRLEQAAEQVAEGNFSVPIPIGSADEVGQLAMTFDEMQRRLARLDSARREFIANASHELRTPIFSLGGFVELLETEDPDPEARREFVATMRGQVDRLTKLATDLLDLSKLDADAVRIQAREVDLGQLASDVAAEFAALAERHGSTIAVGAAAGRPAVAVADPDRVGQIMRILLDNALAHTPEGTSIAVNTIDRDGTAGLVVSDDGPGIAAAERQRVFERFYTGSEARGSGLGLAIARELALLMGGTLEVRSGGGRTDFTLGLRAAEAPGGAEA